MFSHLRSSSSWGSHVASPWPMAMRQSGVTSAGRPRMPPTTCSEGLGLVLHCHGGYGAVLYPAVVGSRAAAYGDYDRRVPYEMRAMFLAVGELVDCRLVVDGYELPFLPPLGCGRHECCPEHRLKLGAIHFLRREFPLAAPLFRYVLEICHYLAGGLRRVAGPLILQR